MTVFLAIVFPFVKVRNIIVLVLLQTTLSNDLAAWNPVPSSVSLNRPAEGKS